MNYCDKILKHFFFCRKGVNTSSLGVKSCMPLAPYPFFLFPWIITRHTGVCTISVYLKIKQSMTSHSKLQLQKSKFSFGFNFYILGICCYPDLFWWSLHKYMNIPEEKPGHNLRNHRCYFSPCRPGQLRRCRDMSSDRISPSICRPKERKCQYSRPAETVRQGRIRPNGTNQNRPCDRFGNNIAPTQNCLR